MTRSSVPGSTGRQKQTDLCEFDAGMVSMVFMEFQDSQGYIERRCLKVRKQKEWIWSSASPASIYLPSGGVIGCATTGRRGGAPLGFVTSVYSVYLVAFSLSPFLSPFRLFYSVAQAVAFLGSSKAPAPAYQLPGISRPRLPYLVT